MSHAHALFFHPCPCGVTSPCASRHDTPDCQSPVLNLLRMRSHIFLCMLACLSPCHPAYRTVLAVLDPPSILFFELLNFASRARVPRAAGCRPNRFCFKTRHDETRRDSTRQETRSEPTTMTSDPVRTLTLGAFGKLWLGACNPWVFRGPRDGNASVAQAYPCTLD